MIQIIIRMASVTHVPHLFSLKHIFLEENTASLSIQKKPSGYRTSFGRPMDVYMKSGLHIDVHWTSKGRLMPIGKKGRKNWIGTIILATQNSIKQLFNVPRCHSENLSYENIFLPFKYTFLLFLRFYFFAHKYKGHDFLRASAFAPVAPPSTTCLNVGRCRFIFSLDGCFDCASQHMKL